ncbi:MAG: hypothetical protein CM15mV8_1610 [Caudoviricetes sp.]|nr:MAG: hypothetical protein CM15mV8_1610 [Caudoviricetes sp.]
MKLRSDNAILKANAVKMEEAISDQQELITQQKKILKRLCSNQKMNELVGNLKKDLEDLEKRFNKNNRDFANLFRKNSVPLREYNKGSDAPLDV